MIVTQSGTRNTELPDMQIVPASKSEFLLFIHIVGANTRGRVLLQEFNNVFEDDTLLNMRSCCSHFQHAISCTGCILSRTRACFLLEETSCLRLQVRLSLEAYMATGMASCCIVQF